MLKVTARGISQTPTIVIGQNWIEAPSNVDRLKEKLESYLKQANP
ncbi:MAG: hypothetical protein ABSB28_11070 [Candidatus Bathyarchaeia archaeon]